MSLFASNRMSIQQTNAEWVSHSETSSVVKLPEGLTFKGLDFQTGLVSPSGVFGTLFRGRILSTYRDDRASLSDHSKLIQDYFLLVLTGDLYISKDVYNVSLPKYPVYVDTGLMSYRKSSYVLDTFLTMPGIPKPAASVSTTLVCVDKDTRKSIPLPEWWRTKYIDSFEKANKPKFTPLTHPRKLVCQGFPIQVFTFPVRRREMDPALHTHTTFFLEYCLDALEHHLFMNKIKCDINTVSLLLKSARFLHRSESAVGDVLDVAFWDDETSPQTVCFDITKSGQSIYQARMQFYGASEVFGRKQTLLQKL